MKRFLFAMASFMFAVLATTIPGSADVASGNPLVSFQRSLAYINVVSRIIDYESCSCGYFDQKDFVRLHPRSVENLPLIKATITDAQVDEEDQVLAVHLAQCLPLPEYLELVKFGLRSLEAGNLRPGILRSLVSPGNEWGTLLENGYERPEVRRVLDTVLHSSAATQGIRDAVNDVLDGTGASFIEAHGGPSLSCVAKKAT